MANYALLVLRDGAVNNVLLSTGHGPAEALSRIFGYAPEHYSVESKPYTREDPAPKRYPYTAGPVHLLTAKTTDVRPSSCWVVGPLKE